MIGNNLYQISTLFSRNFQRVFKFFFLENLRFIALAFEIKDMLVSFSAFSTSKMN